MGYSVGLAAVVLAACRMNFDPIAEPGSESDAGISMGAVVDAVMGSGNCPAETTCFVSVPGDQTDVTCEPGGRCFIDCRSSAACLVDCNGAERCVVQCSADCLVDSCRDLSCWVQCPGATFRDGEQAICI